MEGNRRYRRWFSKQPKEYQENIENTHRLIVDMKRQHDISIALDGINARIIKDEDATKALMHLYNMTGATI
jgi:hypothetical protein